MKVTTHPQAAVIILRPNKAVYFFAAVGVVSTVYAVNKAKNDLVDALKGPEAPRA